ncbi:MAG: EF-hand domain-containing protein [Planctomycetes bacterium]|nr:EF-hand domain-containing protein [Planctomycetota bacterium]
MSVTSPAGSVVAPRARLGMRGWTIVAVAFAVMLVGWHLCWHFADDAFITYRYLSNAMLGRGLVWNPAPFAPVDGNTDFLWSLLLLSVWKVFGVEPPDIANWLTLGFGCVTFALLARAVWRIALPERLERARAVLLALSLALLVTNRGFLATLSSGLGIAIFNALLFAWSLLAASPRSVAAPRRWLALGLIAGATGVARPEGLLVVAATSVLAVWWSLVAAPRRVAVGLGSGALAVVPVLCHVAWRRATTGDWLPCTYYAKTIEAWPESGARYFASYVVEFGLYVWLAVAASWVVRALRSPGSFALLRPANVGAAAVGAVFAYHFAYYTFFMGGDLFEWRVYTHLAPWVPLSLVAMARSLGWSGRTFAGIAGTMLVLAQPIGWIKFAHRDGDVAPHVPAIVRPLVEVYDDWQRWLGARLVCKRNYEMKANFDGFVSGGPTREEGSKIPWDGFPVAHGIAVGVLAWVLPNVAVIDDVGLNDAVIARNPVPTAEERLAQRIGWLKSTFAIFDQDRDGRVAFPEYRPWSSLLHAAPGKAQEVVDREVEAEFAKYDLDHDGVVTVDEYIRFSAPHGDRMMAHERTPPPGYVEGFRPNVVIDNRVIRVTPREKPLTEAEIRAHEAAFRERVRGAR